MERPQKRARLLSDESGSEDEDPAPNALNVNADYAKRFQHNQQRAERHRLEEKYGKNVDISSSSESDSESEDDEGDLATEMLDDQIAETLAAIKSKDPRVYDSQSVFYDPEDTANGEPVPKAKEKPIHLRDYHRKNLLDQAHGQEPQGYEIPSYSDEQNALKRDFLDQVQKENDQEGSEFLVKKPSRQPKPASATTLVQELDVDNADRDPETFLSNFMASRAWVPSSESRFQAFESDDDDDDERADDFEQAYNMRFEDPALANEKLVSHSREAAAKYSVRREEPKGRQKARERERTARDAEKKLRQEEKARLRRLKVEDAQAQWLRLKDAAGLKKQHISDEMLMKFLEKGFEEENWDDQMTKLLGASYYEEQDNSDNSDQDAANATKSNHVSKPKWSDDIDIGDIVPGFDEEEEMKGKQFTLSDNEDDAEAEDYSPGEKSHRKKDGMNENNAVMAADSKRQARLDRQKIEALVDSHLATSMNGPAESSTDATGLFRYRETSPTSHGLSAQDILMASDSQLNQFVGLKKLAAFRDENAKARDEKKLSKKGRLRKWRQETFGNDSGATMSFEEFFNRSRGLENRPDDSAQAGLRRHKAGLDNAVVGSVLGKSRKRKTQKRGKRSTAKGSIKSSV